MRALVVDDSRAMRMILRPVLQGAGLRGARGGQRPGGPGPAEDQGEDVDLMLVDWNMPVMNGYDCSRRAGPTRSWATSMQVMMVTTETESQSSRPSTGGRRRTSTS